jgi:hypothetical protein
MNQATRILKELERAGSFGVSNFDLNQIAFLPLTRGKRVLVDAEDFDFLSQWKWHCLRGGYAARSSWKPRKMIYMHRILSGAADGEHTDHINQDKLDNRKGNLRIVTNQQNMMNRPKYQRGTAPYKGLYWHHVNQKWVARVRYNGKSINAGSFVDPKEAALAYNRLATDLFGKYAFLNEVTL